MPLVKRPAQAGSTLAVVVARGAARKTLPCPPGHGAARVSRIGLLSAPPLLLGGGAHLVGGGTLPAVGVLLAMAGLVLLSVAVSGRRCRFPLLVVLLGVEQGALHLLFGAASSAAMCMPGGSMPTGHALDTGHAGAAGPGLTSGAALQACAQEHAMTMGWLMIAAHAVATVLVAWLLARGEAWWWRTVAAFARIVTARPTRRRARPAQVTARTSLVVVRVALATASPRGPPLPS